MKKTFASLAAAGLLLGGTAAFAADQPYSAPTPDKPGVQSQGEGSVPVAPSAPGTVPAQQDQGASKRPPGRAGYTLANRSPAQPDRARSQPVGSATT
jgi:hypothetical protein